MAFGLGMRLGGASASSPTVAATRVSSSRQAQRSSFSAAPLPARVSVAANVSTTTDRAVLRSSLDLSLQVLALQTLRGGQEAVCLDAGFSLPAGCRQQARDGWHPPQNGRRNEPR